MTTNTSLKTSEADFFKLKNSLVEFLKTKPDFTDYEFDGSALNILTDVLAYGAHIQAAHANLVFSESFLDSAQQRSSVVSHAKQLGYVPRSKVAAYARLQISFTVTGNPSQYVIPKNTRFGSTISNVTYYFVTVTDTIIENNGSNLFVGELLVYQGKYTEFNYTVNTNENQRFLIPSDSVDTRFLSVSVANNSSAQFVEYSYSEELNLGDLGPNTNTYFLQESYDGFYQVYFGNGTIGKSVSPGNIVKLNYIITDGKDANGARSFSLASSLSGTSNISITTLDFAQNGSDKETVDSIKYLAPFFYQAQKRAVTENDYKAILKATYSDIDDVAVWGGEKNIPPFYGKVFLAVKPKNSTFFSNFIKQSIQNNIISKFNVLSIRPEIVDPDYIDVSVRTVVTYDSKLYKPGSSINLESSIESTITSFFASETNKFGNPLYYSKLVSAIDSISPIIKNSVTNITLEKSAELYLGASATYTFEFNNFLHPGSLTSNEFIIDGVTWKLRDIPNSGGPHLTGDLAIYRKVGNNTIYLTRNAGTINYNTGELSLTNFKVSSLVNQSDLGRIYISVSPGAFQDSENPTTAYTDYNVYTNERDQIIRLNPRSSISIIMLPD